MTQNLKLREEILRIVNFCDCDACEYNHFDPQNCSEIRAKKITDAIFSLIEADRRELVEENKQLRACHEAELGVCQQHCDVVRELVGVLSNFINIDDVDKSRKGLLSCQGQGMDGYTKLANYESCVKKARIVLATASILKEKGE